MAEDDSGRSPRSRAATAVAEEASKGTPVFTEFHSDILELLTSRLVLRNAPDLAKIVSEIERKAEHYFTIEKKRQNVRGEGFEDTLEWLLENVARVPANQICVRETANCLPGFKPELTSERRGKDKVPKPDIVLLSPDRNLTLWILTAKWSLRQDRLDQFGQESAFYNANRIQKPSTDFVLVTNEMDVARLRDVLSPPEGAGGFHFPRVYHINPDLLEKTQGTRFADLEMYRSQMRLLSLADMLRHAEKQFGAAPPATTARPRKR